MGWGVRCPILVGREGPVSLIADAVRRLRSGNGAALVVVGEAGVGKTRLAEYLGDAATTAGLDLVHGRALPEGLGGSLRPIAEMLLELTRDRTVPGDADVAPYVTVLASLVPHWRDPDDEAREMATACAAAGSPAGKPITSVVSEAEGLPLLVEDLLATGDLEGIAPPRFEDTVRARLARLDARQRTVLGAAAVLGHRFDWRLLDQAAGVQRTDVAEALHRCTALQLVVTDGPGFAFRHALTRDVILAWLGMPERCRLSLAAAGALASAAGDHDDDEVLLTGRLLADGGQPVHAAQVLLRAGRRAFAAGSLSSAERFLREAAQAAGSSEDIQAEVECQLAQVLLHAGQPSEAAAVASRMVAVTDGRDPAAATAMRLVLARAAVMTAAWDNAWTQLAEVRRSRPADWAVDAEVAVIEAQVALGDGLPDPGRGPSISRLRQQASRGTQAGPAWPARRWKPLARARGCMTSARRQPPSPGHWTWQPQRTCGCTASGSSMSSAQWKCCATRAADAWNRLALKGRASAACRALLKRLVRRLRAGEQLMRDCQLP